MAIPATNIIVYDILNEMSILGTYGAATGPYPITYLSTYLAWDGWADVNSYSQLDVDINLGGVAGLCGKKSYSIDLTGALNVDYTNWTISITFSQNTPYPATSGPNYAASNLNSAPLSPGDFWIEDYYDGNIDSVQVNWGYTGRPPGPNTFFNDNNGAWPGSPFVGSASSASVGGGVIIDNCINYQLTVQN
jgi:hypothetical protein